MKKKTQLVHLADGTSLLVPFILITSLFFLWGFAHSILDVLNKHFQDALGITKAKSALVQAVVYGGYFLMALPAGAIIRRWGYRTGVLTGLLLYGTGALLFIPGGSLQSFGFFLFSLFVIGCGLTCLETAANPYVTVLGEPAAAERRINLAQSFNGLGWICGPLVGGFFLFAENSESNISLPYAIIGIVVLLVAVVFSRVRLPEITAHADTPKTAQPNKTKSTSLWKQKTFTTGLVTLFLYVAAQTGINSFFINYATEQAGISAHEASIWLSFGGMGLFMLGRMGGSWLMGYLQPENCWLSVQAELPLPCWPSFSFRENGTVGLLPLFPVRVHHVPDHLCPGYPGTGRTDQTGFLVPDHVHRGGSRGSDTDGLHRRHYFHGTGFHRSAGLLCGNRMLRNGIQES